jgi:hypothetical protein
MLDDLLKDPFTFLLFILFCIGVWFFIMWWLLSTAVKKGVSELTILMKKNLELKGMSKEEVEELLKVEQPKTEEVPWNEVNAVKKESKETDDDAKR